MQAAVLESHNSSFIISDVVQPVAGDGQVLVRVKSSGTNPLDVKIRSGNAPHAQVTLPAILGIDMAGIVESVGNAVTGFKEGDEVFGMTGGIGAVPGSLAEFTVVDADLLAIKPQVFSMKEAAATPLIFITAWEGLVDKARIHAGQKVLIHGGAGGVGHMAVQIAKAFGAETFATVSAGQEKIVGAFGATPINYEEISVEQYVDALTGGEGFDIVYDTVGSSTLDDSFHAVKKYTGHVVSCLGWGTHKLAPLSFRAATYSGVFTLLPLLTGEGRKHHGEILKEARRLADEGKLKVHVDPRKFTLKNIEEAHSVLKTGKKSGKIVIDID
ncbi:MAG TPA: zinc-dependent alcohol dehydrogenase family protein [Bacteroidales bacterium]|nr:zinc-dependent alcohol dehydrogenase family protein [Bacteroidales bacterium]